MYLEPLHQDLLRFLLHLGYLGYLPRLGCQLRQHHHRLLQYQPRQLFLLYLQHLDYQLRQRHRL